MNVRSYSPLFFSALIVALAPNACGGDSNEADGKGGGAGEDQGGTTGKGGTAGTAGKGGTSGTSGTAGKGGTSGAAGKGGSAGTAGDGGTGAEAGDGMGGAAGAGADGGESGSGGQPECQFATNDTVMGTLKITTDDNYRLYVNGTLIDGTPRVWSLPQTYMVNILRHPAQKNVIAVEGSNTQEISGLDRGIIVDLAFDAGGGTQSVLSDATWKLSTTLVSNWFTPGFVDTAWVQATDEGAHGIAPYGAVLGTSTARWIWSYLSTGDAASKPDMEQVWVRKSFYVTAAGSVSATPTACP